METLRTAFEHLLEKFQQVVKQLAEADLEIEQLSTNYNNCVDTLNLRIKNRDEDIAKSGETELAALEAIRVLSARLAQAETCDPEPVTTRTPLEQAELPYRKRARIIGVCETLWTSGAKVLAIQFYRDMFDTDLVTARDAVKRIVNDQ